MRSLADRILVPGLARMSCPELAAWAESDEAAEAIRHANDRDIDGGNAMAADEIIRRETRDRGEQSVSARCADVGTTATVEAPMQHRTPSGNTCWSAQQCAEFRASWPHWC